MEISTARLEEGFVLDGVGAQSTGLGLTCVRLPALDPSSQTHSPPQPKPPEARGKGRGRKFRGATHSQASFQEMCSMYGKQVNPNPNRTVMHC